MSNTKKLLAGVLAAVMLLALAAGGCWYASHFIWVDFRSYPREAEQLDLRGADISVAHYERLREKLPDCEILWDVPFQGRALSRDITSLTLTRLDQEDIRLIGYFSRLQVVEAEACPDYPQLIALGQHYPQLEIRYRVALGEDSFPSDARQIILRSVEADHIPLLQYLPDLRTVAVAGGDNMENFSRLQAYCREHGISFRVCLGEKLYSLTEEHLEVSGLTDGGLSLLTLLPKLKTLHVVRPKASAEGLLAFQVASPHIRLTWEQEAAGKLYSFRETQLDLSGQKVGSLTALEHAMNYFPELQKVILDDESQSNEALAAWRERAKEDYQVVWTVRCGRKLTCRTDAKSFMPVRENVYYFNDQEAYNLRYCQELVALDIGHMSIHDISFVEYMPQLQYLILAHTQVQDISPIKSCKKLKFLELDWSPVRDFSPLEGCVALEDLNIGNTYADVAPICKLTWLKNLWMVGRGSSAWPVTQALPDTKIVASGSATVAGGWRELPNYFAMRDVLEMHYMSW